MAKKDPFKPIIFTERIGSQWRACFSIGVQTFTVCERTTKKEAEWFAKCLRTAFKNLLFNYDLKKFIHIKSTNRHPILNTKTHSKIKRVAEPKVRNKK